MFRQGWLIGLMAVALAFVAPHKVARAQGTDYTAGKTPPQLFASDCSACHQSPRGLAKSTDQRSLTGFLREHYTTKVEAAGALAAYLISNPGSAAEPRGRQSAPRGSQANAPRPAVSVDGLDNAERPAAGDRPRGSAARDPAKPADPKARAGSRKKADQDEAAREAAKAAEEAAKSKVRAYATTGQGAVPREGALPVAAPSLGTPVATPEVSSPVPDAAARSEVSPANGASPNGAGPSERPAATAPAAETPAGTGGDRPAQAPPG